MLEQNILMTLMLLLKIFMKTKLKILVVFDDMIADMLSDKKKLNPIVTELFIGSRKLNVSFVFITQSYFVVSKNIKLSTTH